jgi:adenine-specific DNA-methyltransferase
MTFFGTDRFTSEIVWQRNTAHNNPIRYGPIHDLIFYYTRSDEVIWNKQYVKYDDDYIRSSFTELTKDGRQYRINEITGSGLRAGDSGKPWRGHDPSSKWAIPTVLEERLKLHGTRQEMLTALDRHGYIEKGKAGDSWPRLRYFLDEMPGVVLQDIWTDIYRQTSPIYSTQKPEALLERIVKASSEQGSIVADFFCGSGTTLAVAETLGRRWVGCDPGRWATHITRKRLLGIENCKPFEVLNLGKYERQYWQGVTFGDAKDKPLTERALFEYLAFILKLYGAQPLVGMVHLHGKKGKAMVHIGAVDAPVTIAEIDASVDECAKLKQGELHVLGWEWEMGLYDLMVEAAKKKKVKLLLLIIPREVMEQQAAAKGDVRFFELAYLEAEIKQSKRFVAQVGLKDFVIPNTELIPEEVRGKVKKWSDYIDYWAVDWDFRNDTFMQGWAAYRTRNERKLPLVSDPHTYEKAGMHRLLVKVIEIFGNDTSQSFDVEVK